MIKWKIAIIPHPVRTAVLRAALCDTAYDYLKASSATDCTGVVPRPPQDSAELDSYLDVYNFLPQCAYAQPNSVEIDMLKKSGQGKGDSV